MKHMDGRMQLSPTDLSGFLECAHLTGLQRRVALGELERPRRDSRRIEALQQRGIDHEKGYLAHLRTRHDDVVDLGDRPSLEDTVAAMQRGADVIYQARLAEGEWAGYADFLVRVPQPSALGDWSYEAQDTKLARTTKGGTLLQLSVYSMLLERLQGRLPDFMVVVPPGTDWIVERYRTEDFAAYFRLLRDRITRFVEAPAPTYPDLVNHCDLCDHWPGCERIRRADDHLCYVADMSSSATEVLRAHDIPTLAALAQCETLPTPDRGSLQTLEKLRAQARIQLEGRESGSHVHALRLPIDDEHGFRHLPAPTPDDIFLDFEGSHFAEAGVQEYLTGYVTVDAAGRYVYTALWADDLAQEQANFEAFIDLAIETIDRNPNAHIVHFAPYEPAALKRMMGRFASRENELDRLLRSGTFLDLHGIVRRSLIASVESYSIKQLEPFFGFEREQDLRVATAARRDIESALETGPLDAAFDALRASVEAYNREDCESTHRLYLWLETLRAEAERDHGPIPRPELAAEAEEEPGELDLELQRLRDALLEGVPSLAEERTEDQQARYLLGHMMAFHRREEKATWWEYFRLRELMPEALEPERRAVTGLEFVEVVEDKRAPLLRYAFPLQEIDAREQDDVHDGDGEKVGAIAAVDLVARTLDIKHTMKTKDARPTHVYFHNFVSPREIRSALIRLAERVIDTGTEPSGPGAVAMRLLRRIPPGDGVRSLTDPSESSLDAAKRLALALDGDVLALQGPPGTGKTYTGSRVIAELVRHGKRVGVTAASHRVIHNLLEGVTSALAEAGLDDARVCHKAGGNGSGAYEGSAPIENVTDYDSVLAALAAGEMAVLGGTAWAWSREDFEQAVDVLVVDEAGQMALANTLACAGAARNLILLGDPQQLEQPLQCTHPEGTAVSALAHWLGSARTMPPARGLFLDRTWRLPPAICAFTSECYYEHRLTPIDGLEQQCIGGDPHWAGSGLDYLPLVHQGNTARATEEVDAIASLVDRLLAAGLEFTDRQGATRPITADDLLIVAPYNAQVGALKARLPLLARRIGTVDRFQGQEAPFVIYSMTSSSPEDAPRGMGFLYDPHRFNVATSRAMARCILVGSPALLQPQCRTPAQMRMANGFCRYRELAREVTIP